MCVQGTGCGTLTIDIRRFKAGTNTRLNQYILDSCSVDLCTNTCFQ